MHWLGDRQRQGLNQTDLPIALEKKNGALLVNNIGIIIRPLPDKLGSPIRLRGTTYHKTFKGILAATDLQHAVANDLQVHRFRRGRIRTLGLNYTNGRLILGLRV